MENYSRYSGVLVLVELERHTQITQAIFKCVDVLKMINHNFDHHSTMNVEGWKK